MAAISVALVAGPVWCQGALTLADLPGLDETDEDGTKPEDKKPVGEIYGFVQTDATSDIAVVEDFDNPRTPLKGELIPVLCVVAFYDINFDDRRMGLSATRHFRAQHCRVPEGEFTKPSI